MTDMRDLDGAVWTTESCVRGFHVYKDIIPFSETYLATDAFISGVAFKYGARLFPLPKTSVTSLLASSIAEGASILLNSPRGSGRTTSSCILLKPYLKSAIFAF